MPGEVPPHRAESALKKRKCMGLYAMVLYYLGMWHNEDDRKTLVYYWRRYLPRIQLTRFIYTIVFNVVSTYMMWGKLRRMIDFVLAVLMYTVIIVRCGSLYLNRHLIGRLFSTLEGLYDREMLADETLRRKAANTEKLTRRIFKVFLPVCLSLLVSSQGSLISRGIRTRTLPFRHWLPYNYTSSPVFEVTVVTINTLLVLDWFMLAFPSFLFLACCIHLIGQYKLLRYKIANIRTHIEKKLNKSLESLSTSILIDDTQAGEGYTVIPLRDIEEEVEEVGDNQRGRNGWSLVRRLAKVHPDPEAGEEVETGTGVSITCQEEDQRDGTGWSLEHRTTQVHNHSKADIEVGDTINADIVSNGTKTSQKSGMGWSVVRRLAGMRSSPEPEEKVEDNRNVVDFDSKVAPRKGKAWSRIRRSAMVHPNSEAGEEDGKNVDVSTDDRETARQNERGWFRSRKLARVRSSLEVGEEDVVNNADALTKVTNTGHKSARRWARLLNIARVHPGHEVAGNIEVKEKADLLAKGTNVAKRSAKGWSRVLNLAMARRSSESKIAKELDNSADVKNLDTINTNRNDRVWSTLPAIEIVSPSPDAEENESDEDNGDVITVGRNNSHRNAHGWSPILDIARARPSPEAEEANEADDDADVITGGTSRAHRSARGWSRLLNMARALPGPEGEEEVEWHCSDVTIGEDPSGREGSGWSLERQLATVYPNPESEVEENPSVFTIYSEPAEQSGRGWSRLHKMARVRQHFEKREEVDTNEDIFNPTEMEGRELPPKCRVTMVNQTPDERDPLGQMLDNLDDFDRVVDKPLQEVNLEAAAAADETSMLNEVLAEMNEGPHEAPAEVTVERKGERWRQMCDKIKKSRDEQQAEEKRTNVEMEHYLRHCAMHHQTILKLTKELELAFNAMLRIQACLHIFAGIFTLNITTLAPEFDFLVVASTLTMIAVTTEYLLLCLFGNKLTNESEKLREAIYGCEWYGASESFKRSIRIMISRTNKPEVIRGGGLPLSMKSFRFILRTGYYLHNIMVKIIHGVKLNDKKTR